MVVFFLGRLVECVDFGFIFDFIVVYMCCLVGWLLEGSVIMFIVFLCSFGGEWFGRFVGWLVGVRKWEGICLW